ARGLAQRARDEVDQRGLARAVGTDQGHALAGVDGEAHVAGDVQRPEVLVDRLQFEAPHAGFLQRSARLIRPPGITVMTTISSAPITNSQWCGLMLEAACWMPSRTTAPMMPP